MLAADTFRPATPEELQTMAHLQTITVQEAQGQLTELIERLPPGGEIVITRDDKAVAILRAAAPSPPRMPRQLGTLQGSVLHMAADFDALPEGFEEYVA